MKEFFASLIKKIEENKLITAVVAAVLVVAVTVVSIVIGLPNDNESKKGETADKTVTSVPSAVSSTDESTPNESENSQSASSESSSSVQSVVSSQASSSSSSGGVYTSTWKPPFGTDYEYNVKLDVNDNVFMDSLIYTGYNIEKHRSDGLMWEYVLAAHKRGKGWLSEISYDYDGSTTGYETNAEGLPDIEYFNKKDLVCASYATYVYFNFLPNVAGIETSNLTKPANPMLAQDWYVAAKDWVAKGYSKNIEFTAKPGARIDFRPAEEIPIGSIISFCDYKDRKIKDYSRHVVIYAGYVNNQHWVYQVGNDNGPEFCTVERMICGPDPMFPISVISTPSTVMKYFE